MQEIQIIRSKRKSISVEIKTDLRIIVRAPINMSQLRINQFIVDKSKWISEHLEIVSNRALKIKEEGWAQFTGEELKEIKRLAKLIISDRVLSTAKRMGVSYNKIALRFQKSRWGSCSLKGNLNFNCLLALCPEEVIDYVIIHELCHLKYMNHSKSFWLLVEKHCPNYKTHKKWLKDNGEKFISRLK